MFGDQISKINSQKDKAFSVFTKARDQLMTAIAAAQEYSRKNEVEILRHQDSIAELVHTNKELLKEMSAMNSSVSQIESIIKL